MVVLALTGFMTESVKFTFLPFFHPPYFPKYRFCSGLLVSICLWKGLISAGVGCVRVGQGSWGEAGRHPVFGGGKSAQLPAKPCSSCELGQLEHRHIHLP